MITLLLVDDQQAVRQALKMRIGLETDIMIVGEASNGQEALLQVQRLQPDVVLMDVRLPVTDGITVTTSVLTVAPRSKIVMLTMYGDASIRARALQAGAVNFIEKHQPAEHLLTAIREAAQQDVRA